MSGGGEGVRQNGDDVEGDQTGEYSCSGDCKEAFVGCEIASSQHGGQLVNLCCVRNKKKEKR